MRLFDWRLGGFRRHPSISPFPGSVDFEGRLGLESPLSAMVEGRGEGFTNQRFSCFCLFPVHFVYCSGIRKNARREIGWEKLESESLFSPTSFWKDFLERLNGIVPAAVASPTSDERHASMLPVHHRHQSLPPHIHQRHSSRLLRWPSRQPLAPRMRTDRLPRMAWSW